jgi:hypothetical protein
MHENLFADGTILLTAGGSAVFDLVVPLLRTQGLSRPVQGVLRSGCYVTHDHGNYARFLKNWSSSAKAWMRRCGRRWKSGPWCSRCPSPAWPAHLRPPRHFLRPRNADSGAHAPRESRAALPLPPGWTISALNDQHAYLRFDPAGTTPQVGDRVAWASRIPAPPSTSGAGCRWWRTTLGAESFKHATMAEYRAAVDAAQPALNVAALVGHTTLRFAAMQALDRPANGDELARMEALLDDCMAAGAHGMSSGLFYEEAFAAPAEEVTALARVVARHGGVYATHLRSEMQQIIEAMHEAGDSAFEAGVPLIISHHKCASPANWGRTRETLPLIDALSRRQEIAMDAYPYVAGSTVLREDMVDGVIDVLLTWSEPHPEMTGRLISDIAREWGTTEQEACLRLKPGGACYFLMHEDDVERVIAHPRTMIGSDGLPHDRHPHPRLWGAFPVCSPATGASASCSRWNRRCTR